VSQFKLVSGSGLVKQEVNYQCCPAGHEAQEELYSYLLLYFVFAPEAYVLLIEAVNVAGLKVALVEKFDFSSGTSSRSTKLIHGGVRYLQKAVFGLDVEQYRMVKEALAERGNLCQIAPHLAHPLPIMLPVYR